MTVAIILAPAQAIVVAVPSWHGGTDQANADLDPGLANLFPARYFASYGDANHDGAVDLGDFALFKEHFGSVNVVEWTDGDVTGDGIVQLDDFAIIKVAL